jgi:small-conductance mechanosensitive channel
LKIAQHGSALFRTVLGKMSTKVPEGRLSLFYATSYLPEKPLISSPNSQSTIPDPALPTERRIATLTIAFGLGAALAAALAGHRNWAGGLMIGAMLAWLNFRWLRRGLDALVVASTAQTAVKKPRVPIGAYFGAVFRYGLIALSVYVIFKLLKVPLVSMVVGMCALAAAAIAASVYELWHSEG